MIEISLFSFEAKPNMVVSRDVFNDDGQLIVPANSTLTEDSIELIRNNHILELFIYDDTEVATTTETDGYYERIRSTPEFKAFNKDYNQAIASVKNNLNDFIKKSSDHIDTVQLIREPLDMLKNSRSMLHLFDMLHSMRNFDDSTYVHSMNVAIISSIIGKWLRFPETKINQLMLAGLIHDIGKLVIPNAVLNKPGKLSRGEFAIMKTHAVMGYNIIKDEPIDSEVKEAVLLHHERLDGTGYPFGLTDKQIPDIAKIIAIADVYDAMTAARVYRGSLCPFTVLNIMEEDAFGKYDPRFIIPFLHNVASSYLHNTVRLSDGSEGEVVLINDNALTKPIVRIGNRFVDLSKEYSLSIVATL